MPGYTTENMHFGLMRAGFAEAAVTQGRSVVSATDPGRVMTVVDDTTRLTGFPPFQVICFYSTFFFLFNRHCYCLLPHLPFMWEDRWTGGHVSLCGCLSRWRPGEPSDDPVTYQGLAGLLLIDSWSRPSPRLPCAESCTLRRIYTRILVFSTFLWKPWTWSSGSAAHGIYAQIQMTAKMT